MRCSVQLSAYCSVIRRKTRSSDSQRERSWRLLTFGYYSPARMYTYATIVLAGGLFISFAILNNNVSFFAGSVS